jgi:glutathione S-transferase
LRNFRGSLSQPLKHAAIGHAHNGGENMPRGENAAIPGSPPDATLKAMIVVHHLNNSRSQRVLWLLEELGLDYELKRYQRDPQTLLAPASLRAVHPLGKSPVVSDGGLVLAESGAILEYLVERYGGGRLIPPLGTEQYLRCRYWLHYAEGSAMPPLLLQLVFDRIEQAPAPFFVKPILRAVSARVKKTFIEPQLELHLDFMDGELAKTAWFAGADLTVADIQMSFPVEAAAARVGLDATKPHLSGFLERIHARPAYQRALAQGGAFKLG